MSSKQHRLGTKIFLIYQLKAVSATGCEIELNASLHLSCNTAKQGRALHRSKSRRHRGVPDLCLFSANAAGYLALEHESAVTVAFVSGIAGGCALNVAVPLLFEMIMETVFGWADEGGGAMVGGGAGGCITGGPPWRFGTAHVIVDAVASVGGVRVAHTARSWS